MYVGALRCGGRWTTNVVLRSWHVMERSLCTSAVICEAKSTRYLVYVQYDGQNNREMPVAFEPDIVEALKKAIEKLVGSGNYSNFKATSRTDAGVHGIHNSFHIDLVRRKRQTEEAYSKNLSPEQVLNGINFYLNNPAIAITQCIAVSKDFDARKTVDSRTYMYRIICPRVHRRLLFDNGEPILSTSMYQRHYSWIVRWHLDVEKMQQAARYLVGRNDFSVFACAGCQSPSPWKTVHNIEISKRVKDNSNIHESLHDNDVEIVVKITSDSFLYKMVRNIVGVLVRVGRGKKDPIEMKDILEKKQIKEVRKATLPPPQGLYLTSVNYNPEIIAKYKLV